MSNDIRPARVGEAVQAVESLEGAALDAAVAKMRGWSKWDAHPDCWLTNDDPTAGGPSFQNFRPSTDWAHGGPIIERERLTVNPPDMTKPADQRWWADYPNARECFDGPTPLVAAMRAFVASKASGNPHEAPELKP